MEKYNLSERHKKLLENSNEPMIVTTPGYDAICIDCNKKYEELLGYSREELLYKNTHHLVAKNEKDKIFQTHASLSEKVLVWDELTLVKKDGKKLSVFVSTVPLYDETNAVIAMRTL